MEITYHLLTACGIDDADLREDTKEFFKRFSWLLAARVVEEIGVINPDKVIRKDAADLQGERELH